MYPGHGKLINVNTGQRERNFRQVEGWPELKANRKRFPVKIHIVITGTLGGANSQALGETMTEDISKRERDPVTAGRPRDGYTTSEPIKTPEEINVQHAA